MLQNSTYRWQQSLQDDLAQHVVIPHHRFVQLATVSPEGLPQVRTVVCREFDAETDRLYATTELDSDKVRALTHQPVGELCWYFTETWVQYRLRGVIDIVSANTVEREALRARQWQALSANTQQSFLTPRLQQRFQAAAGDEKIPDQFAVLRLTVDRVDHVVLKGLPQRRVSERTPEGWVMRECSL